LNSRIGFSSFPVRVTVGLESNASELVLHVEQTVRAQNDDMVQLFSSDRGMENRRSLLLDPTAYLALQYNQLLFQRGVLCFKLALGLAFADSFMGQSEGRACEEPSRSFRSVTD
jgi:hypothetical protein